MAITAVSLAAALVGCGRGVGPAPRATRGYVVVSIDTLRADHLGCYGYARPTSPFLDSLARRATLFEQAFAQYPSTLVSHMSMFTGLQPREHGVLPPDGVLADGIETFPEVFQRAGFRTAGYTEGGFVGPRFGFRRGFDVFRAHDRRGDREVEKTFHRGARFLDSVKPGERFLLFLHTYGVHAPYDAPAEYVRPFWAGPPPADAVEATPQGLNDADARERAASPQALDYLEAQYDAGIRQTDAALRGLFADLERLGLAGDTTVIVTSDHGEEFREHGRFHHSQVYREVMHVPLLVVHPDERAAVRQPRVVQLTDLAPTLYALARLEPTGAPSGKSLAGLLGRAAPRIDGVAWSEAGDEARAIYRDRDGHLDSLLLFDPGVERWLPRLLLLDAPAGELRLEARAYQQPRTVQVNAGDRPLPPARLGTDWQPLRVDLSAPARVRLEADSCAPADDESSRCVAFELRGRRTPHLELYDLERDPAQRHDLAGVDRVRARELVRELTAHRPRPRGAPVAAALDPETAARLQALGYATGGSTPH